MTNRLLWRVHELDPAQAPKPGALSKDRYQEGLRSWLETQPGLVAEIARDEIAEIIDVTAVIRILERRIAARVRAEAPSLLTLYGCAALTAAHAVMYFPCDGELAFAQPVDDQQLPQRMCTIQRSRNELSHAFAQCVVTGPVQLHLMEMTAQAEVGRVFPYRSAQAERHSTHDLV